jgi:hypothetical protein
MYKCIRHEKKKAVEYFFFGIFIIISFFLFVCERVYLTIFFFSQFSQTSFSQKPEKKRFFYVLATNLLN